MVRQFAQVAAPHDSSDNTSMNSNDNIDVRVEEIAPHRYAATALDGAVTREAASVDELRTLVSDAVCARLGITDAPDLTLRFGRRPTSIDHAWDVLYRDYADVYDEFVSFPYQPDRIDVIGERFDLTGMHVLDIGAGTGRSTCRLARHVGTAVGVEPENAMRAVAENYARREGVSNVSFLAGTREHIPLPDDSVDAYISSTAGVNIAEARRVTRVGGWIISADIAPHAYGGHLNSVIGHPTPDLESYPERMKAAGFDWFDVDSVQEYGSVDAIVNTYGFIFGHRAIDHIRSTGTTSVTWTFRIHHQQVS